MQVSDFDFDLPGELIATRPVEPRDSARLMVYDRATDRVVHRQVRDLPDHLAPDDLLVLNDTRVLPHKLVGRRPTGGRVEVLILERDGTRCRGFVNPARKARPGQPIELEGGALVMTPGAARGGGVLNFELTDAAGGDPAVALERVGRAPLPPYIRRDDDDDPRFDREHYQTIFAAHPGAVAAPTAGLHFTPELFARIDELRVRRAFVTLHVGEGTFEPVRVERVEDHRMHSEVFDLPEATAQAVAETRARGGRVVAVGTTSTRTLESCAADGRLVTAQAGDTALFLYPGRPVRVVDALLTNFHLPGSTLLMLLSALIPRERMLELYREAVAERYRFYSYGDAMLVL